MKIIISNLSFGYKQPLFSNLNLEISTAEITLLNGENGSGKTTFCRLLSGLQKKYEGNIQIGENILLQMSIAQIAEKIMYHKQEPQGNIVAASPDEDLSIWQSKFLKSLNGQHAEMRREVLADLAIPELLEKPFWELSSGQIKRSGLAALLLYQEKFWILDEPFSGLHQQIIDKIKHILIQRKKSGFGALIISHKTDRLKNIADRILKIEKKIIKEIK